MLLSFESFYKNKTKTLYIAANISPKHERLTIATFAISCFNSSATYYFSYNITAKSTLLLPLLCGRPPAALTIPSIQTSSWTFSFFFFFLFFRSVYRYQNKTTCFFSLAVSLSTIIITLFLSSAIKCYTIVEHKLIKKFQTRNRVAE